MLEPDPALQAAIVMARLRFEVISSAYYTHLTAVLHAAVQQGVVEWALFTGEMVATFSDMKVLVGGAKVSVGKVLLPYSLAWSVNSGIREQAYAAQRCCLAATLQRKLFDDGAGPLYLLQGALNGQDPIDAGLAAHEAHLIQINAYLSFYFYDRYLQITNNGLSELFGNALEWLFGYPYDEFIDDLAQDRERGLRETLLLSGPRYLTTHADPVDPLATDAEYEWLMSLVTTEPIDPSETYVRPLTAEFTWSPFPAVRGEPVTFTCLDDTVASFEWDFGDGTSSTEPEPVVAYDSYGTFTATLTVTDVVGNQRTRQIGVYVSEPVPVADFTVDNPNVSAGDTVSFANLTTGTALQYNWNFGDGTSSPESNPSHQYNNAGTYTVSLTAYGPDGQDTHVLAEAVQVGGPVGSVDVACDLEASSFRIDGPNGLLLTGGGTSVSFTDQPAGEYEIRWNPVAGYDPPATDLLFLEAGQVISFTGSYTPLPEPDETPPSVVTTAPVEGELIATLRTVIVTFSELILLPQDAVFVEHQDGRVFSPASVDIATDPNGVTTVTVELMTLLPEGNYVLHARDLVLDMHNNQLDGDGDGVAGGDWESAFVMAYSPGDVNGDGHVDVADFILFSTAVAGPDVTHPPVGCTPTVFMAADFDSDGDVDLVDAAILQSIVVPD